MAIFKKWESKDISYYLWIGLWLATLYHAGLTLWVMLTTAQLPPGYQVPPAWVSLNLGPMPSSYWLYVIVLTANLVWESRWKGKGYVPSTFPFPEILYGDVAVVLWGALWAFAHLGNANGWCAVPDHISHTFATCFFLWAVQRGNLDEKHKPEEAKDKPQPAQTIQPSVQVLNQPIASPAASQPKPVFSKSNESTQKLLDYVHQNGQAKTGVLVEILGTPRRSVIRNLNKLIEEGKLVREGNGAGAVYRIKD